MSLPDRCPECGTIMEKLDGDWYCAECDEFYTDLELAEYY